MATFFKAAFAAILVAGAFSLVATESAKQQEHEDAKRAAVERVLASEHSELTKQAAVWCIERGGWPFAHEADAAACFDAKRSELALAQWDQVNANLKRLNCTLTLGRNCP